MQRTVQTMRPGLVASQTASVRATRIAVSAIVALACGCGTVHARTGDVGAPAGGPNAAGVLVTPQGLVDLRTGKRTPLQRVEAQLSDGPAALRSPDGRYVVYSSFTYAPGVDQENKSLVHGKPFGTPLLRYKDLETNRDELLASAAKSMAWAGEGPIAYAQANGDARIDEPYLTRVMVRSSLTSAAVPWTSEPADYTAVAWAGKHLLVESSPPDLEAGGELLIFDGPDDSISLGQGSSLLAVSPDGRYLFVAVPLSPSSTALRIVDADSGRTVGDATHPHDGPLGYPESLGSWDGNEIVIGLGSELAVFPVQPGEVPQLQPARLIQIPDDVAPFAREPYFSDSHHRIMARSISQMPDKQGKGNVRYTLIDCDAASGACTSHDLNQPAIRRQVSMLQNPSRPASTAFPEEES